MVGAEKGKLQPTDIGIVGNDFLLESFPEIMDYHFTANVEKEFDEVAMGEKSWTEMMRVFYEQFEPMVERSLHSTSERRVGERLLGNDPESGRPIYVKIGRYGPLAQMGDAADEEKPRFAQLAKGMTLESVTLEEALALFRFPRELGEYNGQLLTVGLGRLGAYIRYGNAYVSIPEGQGATLTFEEAVALVEQRSEQESRRHLKRFEGTDIEVKTGHYGPYLSCGGKNYRLSRALVAKLDTLTADDCQEYIAQMEERQASGTTATRGRRTTKKNTKG